MVRSKMFEAINSQKVKRDFFEQVLSPVRKGVLEQDGDLIWLPKRAANSISSQSAIRFEGKLIMGYSLPIQLIGKPGVRKSGL